MTIDLLQKSVKLDSPIFLVKEILKDPHIFLRLTWHFTPVPCTRSPLIAFFIPELGSEGVKDKFSLIAYGFTVNGPSIGAQSIEYNLNSYDKRVVLLFKFFLAGDIWTTDLNVIMEVRSVDSLISRLFQGGGREDFSHILDRHLIPELRNVLDKTSVGMNRGND